MGRYRWTAFTRIYCWKTKWKIAAVLINIFVISVNSNASTWEYYWSNNNSFSQNYLWQSTNNPELESKKNTKNYLFLRFKRNSEAIFIPKILTDVVVVDDKLNEIYSWLGEKSTARHHIITFNKANYFIFRISSYVNSFGLRGTIQEGEINLLFRKLIEENIFQFISGTLFFILGIMLILLTKYNDVNLLKGLFLVSFGVFTMKYSSIPFELVKFEPNTWFWINLLSTISIPPLFLMIWENYVKNNIAKYFIWLNWAFFIFIVTIAMAGISLKNIFLYQQIISISSLVPFIFEMIYKRNFRNIHQKWFLFVFIFALALMTLTLLDELNILDINFSMHTILGYVILFSFFGNDSEKIVKYKNILYSSRAFIHRLNKKNISNQYLVETVLASQFCTHELNRIISLINRNKVLSPVVLTNELNRISNVTKLVSLTAKQQNKEPISINEILSYFENLYKEKIIIVINHTHQSMGDFSILKTVMVNLIENSLKNSCDPIEISTIQQSEKINIKIVNSGFIENIDEIFKYGVSKSNSGTGIGLSICKNLIGSMNGKLSIINSILDKKKFVCTTLILEKSEKLDFSISVESRPPNLANLKKVVIIDDEDFVFAKWHSYFGKNVELKKYISPDLLIKDISLNLIDLSKIELIICDCLLNRGDILDYDKSHGFVKYLLNKGFLGKIYLHSNDKSYENNTGNFDGFIFKGKDISF